MMGSKSRSFDPIQGITLDDLIPADHCYRHLERTFDLSFVLDLVRDWYAADGRPSIDPGARWTLYFTLQLVLFFEGMCSERQLVAVDADRKIDAKDALIDELSCRAKAAESRVSELEQREEESHQDVPAAPPMAAEKPRQRKWWLRLFGIDE